MLFMSIGFASIMTAIYLNAIKTYDAFIGNDAIDIGQVQINWKKREQ